MTAPNNDFKVVDMTTGFQMTINLGNYESAKILKSITISPKQEGATLSECDAMLKKAKDFCRKKVLEEIKEVLAMEDVHD